jgi:hypothetical protein
MSDHPEAWLRGAVAGIAAGLQPVAHALIQTRDDVHRLVAELDSDELHARPGGAAAIAFHVRPFAGRAWALTAVGWPLYI